MIWTFKWRLLKIICDFYDSVKDEYKQITGKKYETPPKNVTVRDKKHNNPNEMNSNGLLDDNDDTDLLTARPESFFIQDEET